MNRRKLFFLTVWLVGCSLVFFTVRELPLAGILERLGEISPLRLVGLLAINSLILFLSVKRWQILAKVFDIQLSLAYLFKVRQAGNTISFVTPGPQFGGEPLQLYWLRQSHEIPLDIALAILGADRFMEIFINLSILLLSVIFIFFTDIEVNIAKTFLIMFLTVAILTILLVLFFRQPEWLKNIFKSLFSRFTHTVSNSNESQNASSGWGRILTKIERRYPLFDGLNLTFETIDGIIKHNGPIRGKPTPQLSNLKDLMKLNFRTFGTGEAQLAAIADDIAYNNHDLDDGLRAGFFSYDDPVSYTHMTLPTKRIV